MNAIQHPQHSDAQEISGTLFDAFSSYEIEQQDSPKPKVQAKVEALSTQPEIKVEEPPTKVKKHKPFRWKPDEVQAPISTPKNFTKVNTHKAGFDKVDKEQVQKIIDSLTEGTPHYEREKQKAKERYGRMLVVKKRVEHAVTNSDQLNKRRYFVDHNIIPELEFRRNKDRIRVCCDADCYYSACEALDNPELRGKPHAVKMGNGPNSILATSSYEARKYGVRAGMPVFIGEALCPSLIIVLARMERYMQFSKMMESVFVKYDPQYMMGSLDEAFLDITHLVSDKRPAADVVNDLRRDVKEATGGLTVSAGCAPNLMVAKIAADMNKPDGQTIVLPGPDENERDFVMKFMADLPLIKVPGIGPVTEGLLQGALDFKVVGDIYDNRAIVAEVFTPFRTRLFLRFALGIGCPWCDIYDFGREFIRKGIGANRTFGREEDQEKLLAHLRRIAEILEHDMESAGVVGGRTFTLRLKTSGFVSFGRSVTLPPGAMVCTADDFELFGRKIFMEHMPQSIRRIGMKLNKLTFRKRPKGSIKQYFKDTDDVLDQDASEDAEGNWKTDAQIEQARECARRFFHEVVNKEVKTGAVMFKQAACKACMGDGGTQSDHALKYSCPVCRKRCFKYVTVLNKHVDLCLGSKPKKLIAGTSKIGRLTHLRKKQKASVVREQAMKQEKGEVKREEQSVVKKVMRKSEMHGALNDISNGKVTEIRILKKEKVEIVKDDVQSVIVKKEEAIVSDAIPRNDLEVLDISEGQSRTESCSQESIPSAREFADDGLPEFLGQVTEPTRRTKRKKVRKKERVEVHDLEFNSEDGLPVYLGQPIPMGEMRVKDELLEQVGQCISMRDDGLPEHLGQPLENDADKLVKGPTKKRAKLSCRICDSTVFRSERELRLHVDICDHAASWRGDM